MNISNPQQLFLKPKRARRTFPKKASQKPRVDRPVQGRKNERPVSQPVAKGKVVRQNKPMTTHLPNGDILIRHREFVSDVNVSQAFAASTFSLNPGLPGSFPWLSTLARSYESYRFEKLQLSFETFSASTSTGTALIAIDYDASDAAPTTKTQAMAYRGSVRSPIWSDCEHNSDKEDLNKRASYYVRGGALSANQDVKLYDVGNAFFCSQGGAGVAAAGELYIDYAVRLMTPQLGPAGVGQSIFGIFTGTVNSAPFSSSSGNLPAAVVSSGTTTSTNTWTFTQPWEGFVSVNIVGTTLSNTVASGTATSLELADVVNTAATNEVAIYSLSAPAASTFILTIANATVSSASAYFAQADS